MGEGEQGLHMELAEAWSFHPEEGFPLLSR